MSIENVTKFQQAVAASPELRAKVEAAQAEVSRETAEKIAALSAEAGLPCTPEDFLAADRPLSDDELNGVSGGFSNWGSFLPERKPK